MKSYFTLFAFLLTAFLTGIPVNSQAAKPDRVKIPSDAVFHKKSKTWYFYRGNTITILYENRYKKAEGNMINGKRNGNWNFYFKNGKIKGSGNYVNGTMSGLWRLYFSDGTLRSTGNYKNNLKDGEWHFYFNGGTKKSTGTFVAGVKHGSWTEYYKNGKVFYKGRYQYGRADGSWTYYFHSGKLYQSGNYKNDRKEGKWTICIYPDEPCQVQEIIHTDVPKTTGLPRAGTSASEKPLKDDAESILKSMDSGASSGGWGN